MTARTYGESCGIAHGLDVVGERWAGLVVRELVLGPKRFTDLATDLSGASPSVLTDRLRELERRGVVEKAAADPPARARLYRLTPWGRQLGPILTALGTWALRSPTFDPSLPLTDDAAVLTLDTYFVDEDSDWDTAYELRVGRGVFDAQVLAGRLRLERGPARQPAAVLTTDAFTFTRMLGPDPERPVRREQVRGDLDAMVRLLAAVQIGRPRQPGPLPEPDPSGSGPDGRPQPVRAG